MKKLYSYFSKRLLKILISYIRFSLYHYILILAILTPIALSAGYFTFKLFSDIRTDIATLLPQQDVSVRQLHYIVDNVGSLGYLFVSVHSNDFEANKKAMRLIAGEVKKLPSDLISAYEYNTEDLKSFLFKHGLYYMQLDDLHKLKSILAQRVSDLRMEKTGVLLEPPDYRKSNREIKRLVEKYKTHNEFGEFPDGFFASRDKKTLVMVITPSGSTNDVEFSRRLIAEFGKINQGVKEQFDSHLQMDIGLSGVYVSLIENIINVVEDAIKTASLTFVLVFLALFFYFRSFRTIFVISTTVLIGALISFAASYFLIGYLNQLSVFLGAIIIGNGINFSIIQVSRYFEERAKNIDLRRSLLRGVVYTLSATGMAAFTASIAYGILAFTKFEGFSKFGIMGGIGMIICWLTSYFLIPPLLVVSEKVKKLNSKQAQMQNKDKIFSALSGFISRRYRPITYSMLVVVPLSIFLTVVYISQDRMEYNTINLGNRDMEEEGKEYYYSLRVEDILGNGLSPAVLYAPSREMASRYASSLNQDLKTSENPTPFQKEIQSMVGAVHWLDEAIPDEQEKKLALINEMRAIFLPKYLALMQGSDRFWGERLLAMLEAPPVSAKRLPKSIQKAFTDKRGEMGRVFYVTMNQNLNVHNIHNLIEFNKTLKEKFPIEDDTVRMASDSGIFSDIVVNVSHEGPLVTAIALFLVSLLILSGSRRLKDFFIVTVFLGMGMFAFVGTLLLIDMHLNFFNYVTIPITIGIGADYAINFYFRYVREGRGRSCETLITTGSAVALCSLTTIIGYGTMIIANNLSLSSFGLMAIIGEFACVVFALFYLPAFLEFLDKRKQA